MTDIFDTFCDLVCGSATRLTAVPRADARSRHVDDALAALEWVDESDGDIVDVGSGTGVPGLVLALARPARHVDLLEASLRKATALADIAATLGAANVAVIRARAEDHARGDGRDRYGLAVCRALAPPPVATELCLPLLRPGGRLLIWAGSVEESRVRAVAEAVGGALERVVAVAGAERRTLVAVSKLAATPARFPRRTGMAAKRPLA